MSVFLLYKIKIICIIEWSSSLTAIHFPPFGLLGVSPHSQLLTYQSCTWRDTIAEISRKQKIPVIITNQVYSEFLSREDQEKGVQREVNLVGGDLMKYWSKCIIELKNDRGKRKAVLLKHRNLPQKELGFIIKDKGVFKRGWI